MTYDPVCSRQIDEQHPPVQMDYDGKQYCFCSIFCCKRFENEPGRYLDEIVSAMAVAAS
jgi:YHS domain-containing protein